MLTNIYKIFVYGSLREGMFNYNKLIQDDVLSCIYPASIKGCLYHIENKGYPACIQNEVADSYVIGEIFTFKNFNKTLKKLDKLENYLINDKQKGQQNNSEYIRMVTDVTIHSKDETAKKIVIQAYTYLYNVKSKLNKDDILIKIAGGDWKKYLKNSTVI